MVSMCCKLFESAPVDKGIVLLGKDGNHECCQTELVYGLGVSSEPLIIRPTLGSCVKCDRVTRSARWLNWLMLVNCDCVTVGASVRRIMQQRLRNGWLAGWLAGWLTQLLALRRCCCAALCSIYEDEVTE